MDGGVGSESTRCTAEDNKVGLGKERMLGVSPLSDRWDGSDGWDGIESCGRLGYGNPNPTLQQILWK
jgi:hypothetical protein